MICNAGTIPSIKEHPRDGKNTKREGKRLFNKALPALRMCVERTYAWEAKCKRLLLHFERIQQRHQGKTQDTPGALIRDKCRCNAWEVEVQTQKEGHWD
jgi:hypothetical protein